MKYIFLLLTLLTVSCGKGKIAPDFNTSSKKDWNDNFVVITQSHVCMGNDSGCSQLNAFYRIMDFLNPIMSAYASVSPTTTISYTSSLTGNMTLAAFPPVDDSDPAQPIFGTVGIPSFDVNDLRKCGVNNDERCTTVVIRAFVSSASANFTDDGAIVRVDGLEVGEGVSNSLELITASIGNRNRLRSSPIGQNPFGGSQTDLGALSLDLNNAHFGSYSATITIELAIGPTN